MKTIQNPIPYRLSCITKYSKKLDLPFILCNKNWQFITESSDEVFFYVFKPSNELIVINNGIGTKARWEIISPMIISIDIKNVIKVYRVVFLDEDILVMCLNLGFGFEKEYYALIGQTLQENNITRTISGIDYIYSKYNKIENDLIRKKEEENRIKLLQEQERQRLLIQKKEEEKKRIRLEEQEIERRRIKREERETRETKFGCIVFIILIILVIIIMTANNR